MTLSSGRLSSIELFTGGGGLAGAMHEVGFKHLLVNEYEHWACDTLRENRAADLGTETEFKPWPLVEGDVRTIDFTPWQTGVDVVAGGASNCFVEHVFLC